MRPDFPRVACARCGTVYFVSSETRLRRIGYDIAKIEAVRRCRCGSIEFVRAKESDAPELVTLTTIVTDVIDPTAVEAYEKWLEEIDK